MAEPGTVCLAYVHSNEVAHSWHLSMMDMLGHDVAHDQRIARGGFLAMRCGSGGLVQARNRTAAAFLATDRAEWILWIDTDMGFAPDTADRLVAAADPTDRPIVGGLCFAQQEYEPDGLGGFRVRPIPTLYQWATSDDGERAGFTPWLDYPRDSLAQVAATGSAMILIHRDVLAKVSAASPAGPYTRLTNPLTGQLLSEDLSFCARAAAEGFPIHVDTSVKTTHLKPVWLSDDHYAHPEDQRAE